MGCALALAELERNPSEEGLFVFLNKRGDQVRVLFRDRHGCCVLAKRLDRGRFRRPRVKEGCFCWEIVLVWSKVQRVRRKGPTFELRPIVRALASGKDGVGN